MMPTRLEYPSSSWRTRLHQWLRSAPPGIIKEQRVANEGLMKNALSKLTRDLAGTYFPLTGMDEEVRQQLVDDHFLFVSGDRNLTVAGMERDWPEGRGIYHNEAKTFLLWVNEEDQTRIISIEKGGDVKGVSARLARGIAAVGDSVKAESGKDFALSEQYGYIQSTHSLVAKHVTKERWDKVKDIEFDNQRPDQGGGPCAMEI